MKRLICIGLVMLFASSSYALDLTSKGTYFSRMVTAESKVTVGTTSWPPSPLDRQTTPTVYTIGTSSIDFDIDRLTVGTSYAEIGKNTCITTVTDDITDGTSLIRLTHNTQKEAKGTGSSAKTVYGGMGLIVARAWNSTGTAPYEGIVPARASFKILLQTTGDAPSADYIYQVKTGVGQITNSNKRAEIQIRYKVSDGKWYTSGTVWDNTGSPITVPETVFHTGWTHNDYLILPQNMDTPDNHAWMTGLGSGSDTLNSYGGVETKDTTARMEPILKFTQ